MYDSHAHLTHEPLLTQIDSILTEFKQRSGKGILNVSYDPKSIAEGINLMLNKNSKYGNVIYTALGIHPEYYSEIVFDENDIYKKYQNVISNLRSNYNEHSKSITAVGETGLDYYHFQHLNNLTLDTREQLCEIQRVSFNDHIEIALKNKLALSIHCRDINETNRAYEDALTSIVDYGKGKIKGSFHSYTGPEEFVQDILNLGFAIGFNGISTYPKADNIRKLIELVPNNMILLETDSPFLPPQSIRNSKDLSIRRDYAVPYDVLEVAKIISEIKDIRLEDVLKITSENFERIFLNK